MQQLLQQDGHESGISARSVGVAARHRLDNSYCAAASAVAAVGRPGLGGAEDLGNLRTFAVRAQTETQWSLGWQGPGADCELRGHAGDVRGLVDHGWLSGAHAARKND